MGEKDVKILMPKALTGFFMALKIADHFLKRAMVMKAYLIEQLRELSHVRGKQKTWVAELTDEQLYELFLRLRNRESAKSIARFIQKSWGVLPESSIHSISQGIGKFQKRIAQLLLTPPAVDIPTEELETMDDTLEGMERIAKLQQSRILQLMRDEEQMGIRHPDINRAIQALTSLSKAITREKDWEIKNNGLDPVRQREWERKRKKFDARFKNWVESMEDESKENMVKAIDKLLEECEKSAMTLEVDKDGKQRLIRPGKNADESM